MASEKRTIDITAESTPVAAIELIEIERAELITKLSAVVPYVDSVTWAILWLADIEQLKSLASLPVGTIASTLNSPNPYIRLLLSWAGRARSMEDPEKNELPPSPPVSTIPQKRKAQSKEPIPRRSEKIRNRCIERDEYCAVTKKDEPVEVAHIYPFSMMGRPRTEQSTFWLVLSNFWQPERIEQWKKVVLGPEGTEVLENMLCLSADCHSLWDMARFALQPMELSEDKKVLKARFFWLPVAKYLKNIAITTRPSLPSDLKHIGRQTKLFNCETSTQICSGDIITMQTADPETHPLPSLELLGMQWVLTRVLGMSGAADIEPEEWDSDSEDSLAPGFSDRFAPYAPADTIIPDRSRPLRRNNKFSNENQPLSRSSTSRSPSKAAAMAPLEPPTERQASHP
ncbi:hypothetical protein BDV28DRAFT_128839 [Aspergillus coremiiformis]|uniref:HNH nuclease domain-containing protein n=1 Tax=Aspergillus coremiiformis TaxID=138285 RepID=A0A5N6ZF50_9EURO|nr:hypothetical protein BDV28DRAFT_128839 [Aspergillus coremiiformis]